jgi:hypothetical protein
LDLGLDWRQINIRGQRHQIIVFNDPHGVENIKEDIFTCGARLVWLAREVKDLIVLANVQQQLHFHTVSMRLQEDWLVNSENSVAVVGANILFFAPERNKCMFLEDLVLVSLLCKLSKERSSYFGTDRFSGVQFALLKSFLTILLKDLIDLSCFLLIVVGSMQMKSRVILVLIIVGQNLFSNVAINSALGAHNEFNFVIIIIFAFVEVLFSETFPAQTAF